MTRGRQTQRSIHTNRRGDIVASLTTRAFSVSIEVVAQRGAVPTEWHARTSAMFDELEQIGGDGQVTP